MTREDVRAYAEAGGDQNPLHQDEAVARAAGFPGIIAHGMFTMGHMARARRGWAGDDAARSTVAHGAVPRPVSWARTIVAGGRIVGASTPTRAR